MVFSFVMSNPKLQEQLMIVVGISGVTCGGKTTTAQKLKSVLPNTIIISQDDYFFEENDSRHTLIPELNHTNYDIVSSLNMEKMYNDISELLKNENAKRVNNNFQKVDNKNHELEYISDCLKKASLKILIVEGFCIFNYKPLVPLFDLKYYFTLTYEECLRRRMLRTYEPPDCPGYFEICAWPEHLQQLEEVRTMVDGVDFFSGTVDVTEKILRDIFSLYSIT